MDTATLSAAMAAAGLGTGYVGGLAQIAGTAAANQGYKNDPNHIQGFTKSSLTPEDGYLDDTIFAHMLGLDGSLQRNFHNQESGWEKIHKQLQKSAGISPEDFIIEKTTVRPQLPY